MNAKTDNVPTGLNRFNALVAWWGVPGEMDLADTGAQTKRLQVLATDLGQAFGEASARQVENLAATNEHLARSFQNLLHSRQPQEFISAQSCAAMGLLESLAAQTKVWADLTQKVHSCCASMAREAADVAAKHVDSAAPAATLGQSERPASKEAGKRPAHG